MLKKHLNPLDLKITWQVGRISESQVDSTNPKSLGKKLQGMETLLELHLALADYEAAAWFDTKR